MKICLFGSSFNPPHLAHAQIIEGLKGANFDRLIIVPTGTPNHKQIKIDETKRRELLACFAKEMDVEISFHEVDNKFAYTAQSLDFLDFSTDDKVYFAIGYDSVNTLPSWDHFERLQKMLTFVIIKRPGVVVDEQVLAQIDYQMLDIKTADVSSTQLRLKLDEQLLTPKVYEKIQELKLYMK